jgi:hypothetical protein
LFHVFNLDQTVNRSKRKIPGTKVASKSDAYIFREKGDTEITSNPKEKEK